MSHDADIAAGLISAAREAAAGAHIASISIDVLIDAAPARVEARIERETKTLAFVTADAFSADGARIAAATAVLKRV